MAEIEVDGLVRQKQELEALLMKSPAMEKRVQKLVRKVLQAARRDIGKQIHFKHGDPRKAVQGIKTAVWRSVLGGSVSILNKRHAGTKMAAYEPPRKLRAGQRGGNRRTRSQRTDDIMHYAGPDRGFILRFLNSGVHDRGIKFNYDERRESVHRGSQGGNLKKYGETINTGRRGSIRARNFFGSAGHTAMRKAAQELEALINRMVADEFGKTQ